MNFDRRVFSVTLPLFFLATHRHTHTNTENGLFVGNRMIRSVCGPADSLVCRKSEKKQNHEINGRIIDAKKKNGPTNRVLSVFSAVLRLQFVR